MAAFRAALSSPLVKAALTSSAVMAIGDVTCQALQRGSGRGSASLHQHGRGSHSQQGWSPSTNDWSRTARFGLVGLTLHGPFFLYGFRWLDSALAGPLGTKVSLRNSVAKTLVGNVTIFPVYVASFFTYMGVLEGMQPEAIQRKLERSFPPAYANGFAFWTAANVLNFQLVPPSSRVYYVSVCGLLWNAYLSWTNQRSRDEKA